MKLFFLVGAAIIIIWQASTIQNLKDKLRKAEELISRWQKGIREGTITERAPSGKRTYNESEFTIPDPLESERLNVITSQRTNEDEPKQKANDTYALRDSLGLSDFEPITQQHIAAMQNKKIKPKLLHPDLEHSPSSSPFYNKKIVLTGDLTIDRKEVAEMLFKLGADLNTAVSKKTDYLIVGVKPGWSKMEKAQALIADGANLKILYEADLWQVINEFKQKSPD